MFDGIFCGKSAVDFINVLNLLFPFIIFSNKKISKKFSIAVVSLKNKISQNKPCPLGRLF
jgi:hypothetical protein